jgi:predicted GIY-YIG superfamily endonuclease
MEIKSYYYVYILQSTAVADRFYTGFTENLETRFRDHNSGKDPHTAKYKPWALITYLSFKDKAKALSFEKYLKSHSGKAFANKRLW